MKAKIVLTGLLFMKKYENFLSSLKVLESSNPDFAANDEIYRMGVIGQFNLTFELSWKAMQEKLREQGIDDSQLYFPRQIIKAAYKISLLSNEDIWLSMLSSRNISVHIYDSAKADELVNQIFQLYISEFNILKIKLLTFI